nr:CPPV022 ankyrin repeat protein [Cooks petrelpox virus]
MDDINSSYCISLMIHSIKVNDQETVKLLLKKGFNSTQKDDEGYSALHHAVLTGNNTITQLLIESDILYGYRNFVQLCETYLLSHAIKSNNVSIVMSLLKYGINPNFVDSKGFTPLHYAVNANNLLITKLLLDNGADIEIVNKHAFIHEIMRFSGFEQIINTLLLYGADVNHINDNYAPIHLATDIENEEMVKILIRNGANIDLKDTYNGSSPLHHAVKRINKDIIKMLLDHGANINSVNRYNRSSIYYAIYNNSVDVVNMLLDYGANVNIIDLFGYTPLTVAFNNNTISTIVISRIVISKYIDKLIESTKAYKRNMDFIYSDKKFIGINNKCEEEILSFQKAKIGSDSNLLKCFIRNDINALSKVANSNIFKNYKENFPIYRDLIKNYITEGMYRYKLMAKARIKFMDIVSESNIILPYEIQDIILENLSNDELEKLVDDQIKS